MKRSELEEAIKAATEITMQNKVLVMAVSRSSGASTTTNFR